MTRSIHIASPEVLDEVLGQLSLYVKIILKDDAVQDILNIASGAYAPLRGFLKKADFTSVLSRMRLANDTFWPIPIVLDITQVQAEQMRSHRSVLLIEDQKNHPVALLENIEVYSYDKDEFAECVFGTKDKLHPGVESIYKMGDYLMGGDIILLYAVQQEFPHYFFTPNVTRKIFERRGWKTIVGFQTRNVPHRGHEFLHKKALETVDGLFIQPVIGEKKIDDF